MRWEYFSVLLHGRSKRSLTFNSKRKWIYKRLLEIHSIEVSQAIPCVIFMICIAFLVTIWIQRFPLNPVMHFPLFSFFFFFFFTHFKEGGDKIYCSWDKCHFHALFWYCLCTVHGTHSYFIKKNIKNESHSTIHTFKNYFATVFSIFSFQFSIFNFNNNKFNPNGPLNATHALLLKSTFITLNIQ